MDFAANTEEEDAVLQVMRGELGHVSAERFLSGPGLVNLYRGLVKSDGREPELLPPKTSPSGRWRVTASIAAAP